MILIRKCGRKKCSKEVLVVVNEENLKERVKGGLHYYWTCPRCGKQNDEIVAILTKW